MKFQIANLLFSTVFLSRLVGTAARSAAFVPPTRSLARAASYKQGTLPIKIAQQRFSVVSRMTNVATSIVEIDKPEEVNLILGMTHFIKTVDDIHEALVSSVPDIKFGLGFCEASGERLVRWTGTDDDLIELAKKNAENIACGHSFCLFLGPPTFPLHVLNDIKMVPEVCRIFCATANRLQVVVAETDAGRGIMGVIDGQTPLGVEDESNIQERRSLLKKFGYKV